MSLAELEAERRKILLISGVLLFLAGHLFFLGLEGRVWHFFLGGLLPFLAWALMKRLRTRIKQALVAPLAEAMGLHYWPERGFSQEEALSSGFLPSPDRYEAGGLVAGKVDGIPFASSDIALYREVCTKRGFYYQKLFGGVLYRFRLPFAVEEEVRFGPRGRGVEVGLDQRVVDFDGFALLSAFFVALFIVGRVSLWQAFYIALLLSALTFVLLLAGSHLAGFHRGKKLDRMVPESLKFKRLFDVYGEDQVGARKLLSPRTQEALVRLRKRLGKPIWGAVRGRDLWLAVEGKDQFPVSILRPVSKTFETWKARYQEELSEAFQVVGALRLEEEAKRRGALLEGSESPQTPEQGDPA